MNASNFFGDLFGDFFGGKGPPESVARKLLGIDTALPLSADGVRAVFRFRVKLLRPDLDDGGADALRLRDLGDGIGTFAYPDTVRFDSGSKAEQLAELLWAREDLLRRVPPPVTADGVPRRGGSTRNTCEAAGCDQFRGPYRARARRWSGYCYKCYEDGKKAEAREARRRARADRTCTGCGVTFTPSRSDGIYCKPACRQAAYRKRRVGAS